MIYEEVLQAEKKLDDCINWETGEISEDYESAREELQSVLECGIETLCKIRANKQARIESLKAEINRLTEKKRAEEKHAEKIFAANCIFLFRISWFDSEKPVIRTS